MVSKVNLMNRPKRNRPKRQHFVPKMLLRNFTEKPSKKEQLYFFRNSGEKFVKKTSINNLCVESQIYTLFNNEEKDFLAEDAFRDLENKTVEVAEKIIKAARNGKQPGLTCSEKKTLDWFLFCQWNRVPEVEDPILERSLRRSFLENADLNNMSNEEKIRFRNDMRTAGLTRSVLNPNEKILSILENKGLVVGTATGRGESFVVGSNPLLRDPLDYYLFGRIVKLWLPIAHDIVITPYFERGIEKTIEFGNRDICLFNEKIFRQSNIIAGNSEELIRRVAGI